MKTRMQITVTEELKRKMDEAKDFYGGYSGLIEHAVREFLGRPVEPYDEDIRDAGQARQNDEWVGLDEVKRRILGQ